MITHENAAICNTAVTKVKLRHSGKTGLIGGQMHISKIGGVFGNWCTLRYKDTFVKVGHIGKVGYIESKIYIWGTLGEWGT